MGMTAASQSRPDARAMRVTSRTMWLVATSTSDATVRGALALRVYGPISALSVRTKR